MYTTGIPILCFHYRAKPYVAPVMRQARLWNPFSPIFLITDQPKEHFPDVTALPVDAFSAKAIEFQKHYEHMSSNYYETELFCLQRWIIFSEVLKTLPYDRCFIMDSDVLLYCDITSEHRKYADYAFTLTHQMSPGECYFNANVVHRFAEILIETYQEKNNYYWYMARAWYQHTVDNGGAGGISDMAYLYLFSLGYSGKWLDSMHIVEEATFDHHINTGTPGFEMTEEKKKRISWIDGRPYGHHLERKRDIRFLSLHFQGGAKDIIHQYLREPTGSIREKIYNPDWITSVSQ